MSPTSSKIELEHRIAELESQLAATRIENQQLRALFRGIRDVLIVLDAEGRYIWIAPTNSDLLYRPSQELIGKKLHEVFPQALADYLYVAIQDALEMGSCIVEYELPLESGSIWFSSTVSALDDRKVLFAAHDITAQKRVAETLQRERQLFVSGPVVVFKWVNQPSWPIEYVSPNVAQFGYSVGDLLSGTIPYPTLVHPDDIDRVAAEVSQFSASGVDTFEQQYRILTRQGEIRWIYDFTSIVRDRNGTITHFDGYVLDITTQKQYEEEQVRLQHQIIEGQHAALRELSTPLIPISDKVVVMPLIGVVDSQRVLQLTETLLTGITDMRARIAILDITGVSVVDTQVANALLGTARAASLLGAQVMISGIRPEVAQTLVGLGVDLRGIVTHSTLQSAITLAFRIKHA